MKLLKAVELAYRYARCPDCGNEKTGKGEGKMHIRGDTFKRSCKCGWEVIKKAQ